MKPFIITTLAIPFVFNITATHASSTETAYEEDFPVILSASRLEQSELDTPAAVTVIDRALIEASGARHIPELMRYVPGMQLGHATDNTPIVVYQGLGDRFSRRVQVLIDGRSIYTPSFGGVFWENLPITVDDIEKIEVIRGPNSALYGSNAFSAVISITTRFDARTVQSGIHTTVENSQNNSVKANWNKALENTELSVSSFYYTDEGDTNNAPKAEADQDRRRAINFSLNTQLSALQNLHFDAGVLEGDGELGNSNDSTDPVRSSSRDYDYMRLKYDQHFDNGDNLYLQFSRTAEAYEAAPFTLPVSLGNNQPTLLTANFESLFSSDRTELEVVYTPESQGIFRWVTGGSIRRDNVMSTSNLRNKETIDVLRFFANTDIELSHSTRLGMGGMVEEHDYSGSSFSPKLSLIQKVGDQSAFRLIASQATRAPIAFENSGFFTTNIDFNPQALSPALTQLLQAPIPASEIPNNIKGVSINGSQALENEQQTSFELGFKSIFNEAQSKLDIRLFYDELDNLINAYDRTDSSFLYSAQDLTHLQRMQLLEQLDPNVFGEDVVDLGREFRRFLEAEVFRNFIDLKKYGMEVELQHTVNPFVHINSGITFLRMKNTNSAADIATFKASGLSGTDVDNRVRETPDTAPKTSGFISTTFTPNEKASLNLSYHYIDNSSWLSDGQPNLGIQRIINVYAHVIHPLDRKRRLKIGMGIHNLNRDDYIDFNPRNPSETVSYFKAGIDF